VTAVIALVIDDSRAMRLILRRIVGPLGYDVHEAANGREALEILTLLDRTPEVALVDWNMPVMSGLEFISAARSQQRLRSMALVMVTTESEHSQIVRALAAGAHEYIIKPFTPDAIIEKLALLGLVPNGAAV
jgi:two-component system, chemotaxis family, chemotaxis protein CheY